MAADDLLQDGGGRHRGSRRRRGQVIQLYPGTDRRFAGAEVGGDGGDGGLLAEGDQAWGGQYRQVPGAVRRREVRRRDREGGGGAEAGSEGHGFLLGVKRLGRRTLANRPAPSSSGPAIIPACRRVKEPPCPPRSPWALRASGSPTSPSSPSSRAMAPGPTSGRPRCGSSTPRWPRPTRAGAAWLEGGAGRREGLQGDRGLAARGHLEAFREHLVGIKGPLTTPVGGGIRSLNVALRQLLDLYVCVRPVRWYPACLRR